MSRRLYPLRPLCGLAILALLLVAQQPLLAEDRDEWQQPERVVADLALGPGATVADVGCGTGYFTFRLADAVGTEGHVQAVDIDNDALRRVREGVAREQRSNISVLLSEPTDTKLPAASADAVLVCNVLHEAGAADRPGLMQSIAQALKPGGLLFLLDWRKSRDVTFDPYDKLIPREDLVALGENAGLTFDAEFYYLKYQVFLRFRRPPQP